MIEMSLLGPYWYTSPWPLVT